MSILKDSMVGKAVNTNWGFDGVKPNEKVILNAIIEKTLPVFFLFPFEWRVQDLSQEYSCQ